MSHKFPCEFANDTKLVSFIILYPMSSLSCVKFVYPFPQAELRTCLESQVLVRSFLQARSHYEGENIYGF